MRNKVIYILGLISFVFLLQNLIARDIDVDIDNEINLQALKFKYILETAEKNSVDSLDIRKVSEAALQALIKAIDVQSSYYSSEALRLTEQNHKGASESVGLNFVSLSDSLFVLSVVANSPADSAGIKTGDKILFINGENTYKLTATDALNKLTGMKGTNVNIILKRGFTTTLQELNLLRKEVPITCIDAAYIIPGTQIGYISLNRFSDVSDLEFVRIIEKLKKESMKEMILDLRNNPGGNLDCATKIADEFLTENKIITYTKANNPEYKLQYKSSMNKKLINFPVVIILNSQSASAAEALAGAIQDFDRGLIVGEQSYGKASAQKLWNIKDGSGFSLTVAYYYTPSGRCIHKIPIRENEKPVIDPVIQLTTDSSLKTQLEDTFKKTGGKTQLPIFKTEKGRSVIGGGGIYPDYYVKTDTLTLLTKFIQQRGVVIEYVFNYLITNSESITSEYKNNLNKFILNYNVSNELLDDFILFAKQKNIWNDVMFVTDKLYIQNFIKAVIAHVIWGNNGYSAVMSSFDSQIKKAIEVMPEAEKMVK